MRRGVFVVLALILILPLCYSETIKLKSGKTIEGEVIERTDEYIRVNFQGIPLTYYLDRIESIDGEKIDLPRALPDTLPEPLPERLPEVFQRPEPIKPKRGAGLIKMEKDYIYDKGAKPGALYEAYRLRNEKGLQYLHSGAYSAAVNEFEALIEMIPTEAVGYMNLGTSYKKMGKHQEAIKFLKKALSLDPQDPNVYYNLGNVYLELVHDYQEAAQWYLKAIQKNPNDDRPHLHLGIAYIRLGRYDKARQALEKARKICERKGDQQGIYIVDMNLKTIPR